MVHKSFRLQSSAFDRTPEEEKVKPKRVIFISVEGTDTEKDYFEHLNDTLDDSIIKIEILKQRKRDACSSPDKVLELLVEYIQLRTGEIIPENEVLFQYLDGAYSKESIQKILDKGENTKEFKELVVNLKNAGIDIAYRKYLKQIRDEHGNDIFSIVIDRDSTSHSCETIRDTFSYCRENDILFCISNPCFEFWLLLHVCDVSLEFADNLLEIQENKKVSSNHTFVSKELSNRAGHAKKITRGIFRSKYKDNIGLAMERAELFNQETDVIIDSLGTNLPHLMKKILYNDD